MAIVDRVTSLDLPLDEIIVIGSGLLDGLGLRAAGDIDLLVTSRLFGQLAQDNSYTGGVRNGSPYLMREDVEIWMDWGVNIPNFEAATKDSVVISEVRFLGPRVLIREKKRMGRAKDMRDIQLLEKYLAANSDKSS